MKTKKSYKKFVLYTNPNNVTNRAYIVTGTLEVRELLKRATEFPDSYTILYQGKGTEEEVKEIQKNFFNAYLIK